MITTCRDYYHGNSTELANIDEFDGTYKSINAIPQSTRAAMVEWLRCSTRIHKVLCSNLSITIHGMTLDKSLTAQLSRMIHSYHTEYIISQYVGRKGVQIPPSVKRKR